MGHFQEVTYKKRKKLNEHQLMHFKGKAIVPERAKLKHFHFGSQPLNETVAKNLHLARIHSDNAMKPKRNTVFLAASSTNLEFLLFNFHGQEGIMARSRLQSITTDYSADTGKIETVTNLPKYMWAIFEISGHFNRQFSQLVAKHLNSNKENYPQLKF